MLIPLRRRRWRNALVIMHLALVPYAFMTFIMLVIPVSVHSSTADYNVTITLTFFVSLYAALGFFAFWIFKYLMRVLCFVSAAMLFFIVMFFVYNYFSIVDCMYKQQTTVNITIKNKECQLLINNAEMVVFQCQNRSTCGSKCLPFAKFWQNISKGNRMYIKTFLMPLALGFAAFVNTVLILTIWRGVDEIRFQKDICLFGMHEDLWPPHPVVHSMVYSATKSPSSDKTPLSIQPKGSVENTKKSKGFHVKPVKKPKILSTAPAKSKQ